MLHTFFYLPSVVVKAIGFGSARWPDGRSAEVSRSRSGHGNHSVHCDLETARGLIPQIEAARGRSDDAGFRSYCTTAIASIVKAIDDAEHPTPLPRQEQSDRDRGVLGVTPT